MVQFSEVLTVRIPPALMARIDGFAELLRQRFPSLGRSDAARHALDAVDWDALLQPGVHPGAGAHREGR